MRFIDAPENNLMLNPPQNWDAEKHGPCEAITCFHDGYSYTVTLELEQAEFAALINGGKLKLRVFGQAFPPVSLFVAE